MDQPTADTGLPTTANRPEPAARPPSVVPTREDVARWTPEGRHTVARYLDEVLERPDPGARRFWRWMVLASTIGGAVILVPWTVYLGATLPLVTRGGAWRTAWVGYDLGLVVVLGATGWLAWHRRQLMMAALVIVATLLVVDAWFDLTLSWGTDEQTGAVAAAVLVELPAAVLLVIAEVMLWRRTAWLLAALRGRELDRRPSLWREPLFMRPPGDRP